MFSVQKENDTTLEGLEEYDWRKVDLLAGDWLYFPTVLLSLFERSMQMTIKYTDCNPLFHSKLVDMTITDKDFPFSILHFKLLKFFLLIFQFVRRICMILYSQIRKTSLSFSLISYSHH